MKRKTLLALLAAVILLAAGLFTENWIFYLLNGVPALGISLYWGRKRWARRAGRPPRSISSGTGSEI